MTGTTTTSSSYHHGQLRDAVISLTVEKLSHDTLDGISLRKVAGELGVSHAALYRHFSNKNHLLAAVAEEGFIQLRHDLQQVADAQDDPTDALLSAAAYYVEFATSCAAQYELMFGARLPGDTNESLTAERERCFAVVQELVCRAVGCTRRDALVHTVRLWTLLHGYSVLQQVQRMPEFAETQHEQVRVLIEPLIRSWS